MKSDNILFYWVKAIGVNLVFSSLRPGLLGMADAGSMTITLDQSLKDKPRKLRCILAEEIGHILFPPRPGHIRYHSTWFVDIESTEQSNIKVIVAQDERKALQWATSVLMPDVEFWRKKDSGVDTIHGFADCFEVEEWFVRLKIGYLRMKAKSDGNKFRWRDIIKKE